MAQAADLEAESTHHRIVERVKAAWYEVYFVDRALAVTEANEALVADFARLTAVRYGVGSGAQPEVLRAQVERTGLVDRLVELRERRASAVAGLNALLHRPSETPLTAAELPGAVRGAALATAGRSLTFAAVSLSGVGAEGGTGPAPGVQPVEELQRAALEHNPAVLAQRERVAAGRSVRALAGKAALPDLSLSVAYSRRADFSDFVSLSVSAPLPVFSGRKQDQLVVEETAALAGEQARLRAMVDALNAEIAELAAGMARARDQLLLLRDGILPQAKTTVASATASYRVGEVDFLTLLDAQVTLYRYEIDYHRLLADFARDAASLERATGTEILR
jgi:outer membrane protein TolC